MIALGEDHCDEGNEWVESDDWKVKGWEHWITGSPPLSHGRLGVGMRRLS